MEDKDKIYQFSGTGLTEEQVSWGRNRFNEYLSAYPHLNTLGNSQLLEELVWVEAILEANKQHRAEIINLKAKAGSAVSNSTDAVSKRLNEEIQTGRDEVITLKTKLAMFEAHKDRDAYQTIQELMEKFEAYRKQNPSSFKCTCPFCAKSFALMRRTDQYQEFISPFLEDKILNNKPLMELYHQSLLTKEQVAKVLGVYPQYVDWLDAKCYGRKVAGDEEQSAPTHVEESAPLHTEESETTNQ
jgi:hypothetical protein